MGRPTSKIDKIYQTLLLSERFNSEAAKVKEAFRNSKYPLEYQKAAENMGYLLVNGFNIYSDGIHKAILQKIIFGKSDMQDSFSISHYIEHNRYDDIDFPLASIMWEKGTTPQELIKYIRKNWKDINLEMDSKIEKANFTSKRIRVKTYTERDIKILALHRKGFTDKEISEKLKLGGQLALIRKVISNMKKQTL
jgi:hypothetical protein